jgi:uncharacterized protein YbjT (DUF2867 family)
MERTAIVFGATGLVGNLLLEELIKTGNYTSIRIFVRRSMGISAPGIEEVFTDFSDLESQSLHFSGDDLYICLGTTIKKAGSVSSMEKVDRDLPVRIAELACIRGVKRVAVISSIGASSGSRNYYLRIKGEMELGILKQDFETTVIVRPSMLLGERKEKRAGEIAGKVVMKAFRPVLTGKLLKYRAIHARDVARAMISALSRETGKRIIESDELQRIARE